MFRIKPSRHNIFEKLLKYNILGILVVVMGMIPSVHFMMKHLGNLLDLLSLLNSSVNFVLYATMSNVFRQEFIDTFGFCFPKVFQKHVGMSSAVAGNGSMKTNLLRKPSLTSNMKPTSTTNIKLMTAIDKNANLDAEMPNGDHVNSL